MDELLKNGSIIHWSTIIRRKDPSGTTRKLVQLTCGKCNQIRYMRRDMVRKLHNQGTFTGFCGICIRTVSWAEKNRGKPLKKKITIHGYQKLYKPDDIMADKRGEIYEHRYTMAQHIGRPLERWEHVHHKDGNRTNNALENLELMPKAEHGPIRDMVARIRYLEELLRTHNIPFD